MDAKQRLYYALGQLAYAVAKADGKIQKEEQQKLHDIVVEETKHHDMDFDYSDIIFHLMKKDDIADVETAYKWAIEEINLADHHLTDEMKKEFVRILRKVAVAFPPVTTEEKEVIDKFEEDLEDL